MALHATHKSFHVVITLALTGTNFNKKSLKLVTMYDVVFILLHFQREAPDDMMSCLPVPNTDSIHFHPIHRHNNVNGKSEAVEGLDLKDIPFTFYLDDIHTNFVEVSFVYIDFVLYKCVCLFVFCLFICSFL